MLRKQIRLEKWTSAKNASGDFKESVSKYNLFSEVTNNGGGRSTVNGQTGLSDTISFRVRFNYGFKPNGDWRVVYDGYRFTVLSMVKEKENNFYWLITAECLQLR